MRRDYTHILNEIPGENTVKDNDAHEHKGVQVVYMSAFRPSFCLNGSFARVFSHRHTHTQTDHSTPVQARGNYTYL